MLTKNDLSQIRVVVETAVERELDPVKKDVRKVKKTVDVIG